MNPLRRKLDALLAKRASLVDSIRREKARLAEVRARKADADSAGSIVRLVASSAQRQAHRRVAEVVTRCLSAVFGESAYEFHILFEQKRGRTEARPVFRRGKLEVDPVDSSGGGAVDVAAMALRLACLFLTRPPLRKLLVLDEPLKHLSAEYTENAKEVIQRLASDTGVQVVMVTHNKDLACGKVVEL